jgi:LacI family transcriptional regulator
MKMKELTPREEGKRGIWGGRKAKVKATRRPTMIDVANEAKVSQTTVSLVLNKADGARLSAETRERVNRAAARLGYKLGWSGGSLGGARNAMIAFICDEISTDPWTAIEFDGVREKAWERGFTVSVMATRGDAEMEAAVLSQVAQQPIAGLIYATINTRLIRAPKTPPSAPTVLLNCHVEDGSLPSIVPGEVAGGHAATDYLIRAGHRRIGYVNGEPSMEASRQRLKGYRQALATADLPFDPSLVREGNWQPLSGYEATLELMQLPLRPTAIFCANDLMAVGCYDALRELGLKVPEDIAVMGYDDREVARHLHPPLTTVLLPHFEMGVAAAQLLFDLIDQRSRWTPQLKVECPIVERRSV